MVYMILCIAIYGRKIIQMKTIIVRIISIDKGFIFEFIIN